MSDELLPRTFDESASVELGGEDAPLSASEHAKLGELAALVQQSAHFELSPAAKAQGLAALDANLARMERPTSRGRVISPWWAVPLAAAVLLALFVPLGPRRTSVAVRPDELMHVQNAHLTARLTGAPLPRDELDRAQAGYREKLLASLEGGP